jgi:tetratricopeptide (TPR) repeat protein
MLAAAVVVLLLGGSATGWWYLEQTAAQQRCLGEAQKGIEASLNEAGKLREAGLQQVDNPAAWGATLAAARTALEHARTLLSQEPDLADTALAQQMRQGQAMLEGDAKDWRLLSVFDQVRLEQSQWDLAEQRFTGAGTYPRLAQGLADYGLAIGGLAAEEAAARLRQRSAAVLPQLRAVLEECLARGPKEQGTPRQWLAAVLAVDADPWLVQFRQMVEQRAWAKVEQLVAHLEVRRYHPAVLVVLTESLPDAPRDLKLVLLRKTQQQYPGDFWANFYLCLVLYRSIVPKGGNLPARGEELPVVTEAVAFSRVAVGLRPGNVPAHNNLGLALQVQGDLKGAIACYHKALELEPKFAQAHFNLGVALYTQGDLKEAIACYRKTLDLDPRQTWAHNGLGRALADQGDLKEAIAYYRKALDLDANYASAHTNLGNALSKQGDVKGALACFTKAIDLDPKDATAHYNLGNALYDQGDVKGALACSKRALELDPTLAWAHGALGRALLVQGAFREARTATQKALQLLPPGDPLRPLATRQLQDCRRLLDLDARLSAIDKGDAHPKDTVEQLALAYLCEHYKKRYTTAVRFYRNAFSTQPKLPPKEQAVHRYNAACAAALAAAGRGTDADNLDAKQRSRLRQQALAWLKDALKILDKLVEDPERRNEVRQTLQHWQKDADFDSVRGKEVLAKLPEAERAAWQQLWADVEKLLKKAAP